MAGRPVAGRPGPGPPELTDWGLWCLLGTPRVPGVETREAKPMEVGGTAG